MPQASNQTNEAAKLLAERHDALVNNMVARFDTLSILLTIELDRARGERESRQAIDAFLVALLLLLHDAEDDLGEALPRYMLRLWGVESTPFVRSQKLVQYSESLYRFADRKLDDALQLAAISGLSTGGNLAATVASLVAAPMARLQLHRMADMVFSSMAQESLYSAGEPHFKRKRAVAVLDSRTTALCRRMDGQEQPWDEPFRDPLSGATWLWPPFIYGGLDPDEAYHACRTSVSPV